jgi:lactoylglutathione lyase
MKVKAKFDHYNINVLTLERSMDFYNKALGFTEHHRMEAADGSYIIVYLTDGVSPFLLELTWLRDWKNPYEMGDNEQHLAVRVSADEYATMHQYHVDNGWVCYENPVMGIYFILDPDGYWIEVLPQK